MHVCTELTTYRSGDTCVAHQNFPFLPRCWVSQRPRQRQRARVGVGGEEEQKREGREEGDVCQMIKKLKGFLCRENI